MIYDLLVRHCSGWLLFTFIWFCVIFILVFIYSQRLLPIHFTVCVAVSLWVCLCVSVWTNVWMYILMFIRICYTVFACL